MFTINKRIFYFLLLSVLIYSCEKKSIELLSSKESYLKSEPAYESYLALEYLGFSRRLLIINDKRNSEYFAKKGLEVSLRKDVQPENPLKWNADKNKIQEMIFMQKRMEEIDSIASLRLQLPIQIAHLHYLYDCWISKESKPIFAGDDIANCRVTFSKLLEEIESYYIESKKDKSPPTKIIENKFDRFEISFDAENSNLNDLSNQQLLMVIDHLKKIKSEYNIILVGNGDNNSDNLINQNLAKDRISTVKNYLIANGVIDHLISINYEGEDLPDIVTNDSLNYKFNRIVGIYIFYNGTNFSPNQLPLLQNLYLRDQISKAQNQQSLKN